ncbi:hypothetical protein [Pectobacterium parmentieri]|nr:hypothetical protein [Pectobacterium parmentieri]
MYEPGSFRPLAQSGGTHLHYILTNLTGTTKELCIAAKANIVKSVSLPR